VISSCNFRLPDLGVGDTAVTDLSPVARISSRAFSGFFRPPCCDCSIKERVDGARRIGNVKAEFFHNFLAIQSCE